MQRRRPLTHGLPCLLLWPPCRFFIQITAAVWVVNQSIPFAVLSAAANLQGLAQVAELPTAEKV
jgi:hypothetical protein